MARYLFGRLIQALTTFVLALVVIFVGVRLLPGDTADVLAAQDTSGRLDPDQIREALGLNLSVPVQFYNYVNGLLHGDWGMSISTGQPVTRTIGLTLPVTLELTVLSLGLATIVGILFGIVAALRKGKFAEWLVNGSALFFLSVPAFWLGMILILVFAVWLHWLPASGFTRLADNPLKNLRGMILPVFVLSTGLAAVTMRQMRAGMLDTLSSDFIRSAQAHGLRKRAVTWGYAVRNSIIPVVTLINLQLGFLIAGAVVTEQVFVLPGFGKLMVGAVSGRDYAVVQGVAVVITIMYVTINFLTDIVYTLVDPRVRVTRRAA
jgi:peptide/nickel transport system permease protein